jgi:methylated-DNA-[protein]-cysteine S-methyltransferase
MPTLTFESLVGPLTIAEARNHIVAIDFRRGHRNDETPLLREAQTQLSQYFSSNRETFDLPLDPVGTAFEKAVWQGLLRIPYGRTRTYGELAADLRAIPRAVGRACGRNPIPVIIPCHRMLAANGLGGFSGGQGPPTKHLLLALEQPELFPLVSPASFASTSTP